jgi:hypothetical protein
MQLDLIPQVSQSLAVLMIKIISAITFTDASKVGLLQG